nr:TRNA wybutosine-synthesizing protein like [Ipomoea batatas]
MAAENWASFAGDDEFSNNLVHDFSEVDSALLMSILDDTPQGVVGEDYDDERLRSVIQSLEAEIHGCTAVDDYDHFFTDTHHHHQSFDDSDNNFKNQHFWESDDLKVMDMEMEMEMEMEIESSFSIPNNEGVVVNSWFVNYPNCENPSTIMDGMVEDGYGYLWQETMPQH